jgi:hypothetical protein
VNVGVWCRQVLAKNLLVAITYPINQVNDEERRSIIVGFAAVEKTYKQLDDQVSSFSQVLLLSQLTHTFCTGRDSVEGFLRQHPTSAIPGARGMSWC